MEGDCKEKTDDLKKISKLTISLTIVVFLLAIFLFKDVFHKDYNYLSERFIDAFFCVTLTILFFNVLYEYYTRSHALRELQNILTSSILNNIDIIKKFSKKELEKIINNAIVSVLDEEKGKLIYHNLISPYLDGKYNFRKEYIYNISVNHIKNNKFKTCIELGFRESDHYSISQDITYSRVCNGKFFDSICIGFAFEEKAFEDWINNDIFFFREMLFLEDEIINKIRNFNDSEMLDFIFDEFKFSLCHFFSEYQVEIERKFFTVTREPHGVVLCVKLKDIENVFIRCTNQKFRLKFVMPQKKSCRHFLVTIPEPTETPQIQFSFDENIKNVISHTFFPKHVNLDYKQESHNNINFRIKTWVFPRSGVLFTWDKEN